MRVSRLMMRVFFRPFGAGRVPAPDPRAYARGYRLPSLRDFGRPGLRWASYHAGQGNRTVFESRGGGGSPFRRETSKSVRRVVFNFVRFPPGRAHGRCQGFQTLEGGPSGFSPGRANEFRRRRAHAVELPSHDLPQRGLILNACVRPTGRGCRGVASPGFENPGNVRMPSGHTPEDVGGAQSMTRACV